MDILKVKRNGQWVSIPSIIGPKGNKGDKGDPGPKGDKGDKGDQGDPAPAESVATAVDTYLAANFSNPSNPPLDRSLLSEASAAPADMVGDLKSAITLTEESSESNWEVGSYNYPNGDNYTSTTRIRLTKYVGYTLGYLGIKAKTGYEFSVYAWNAASGAYVGAWMTSSTFATSGTLAWITEFDAAAYPDYKFKVALRNASSPTSDMTTDLCVNCLFLKNRVFENANEINDEKNSINTLKSDVDELADVLTVGLDISPTASSYSTYITGSNKWGNSTTSSPRACGIISIPDGYSKVMIKAHADNYTQAAILTSNSHTNNETPSYATGWSNIRTIDANTEAGYEIPSDGKYLYYTRYFSTNQRTPQSIKFTKFANISGDIIPLGLHEMPENQNVLNIIKRCRQMTDIKWTPAVDLPRYMLVQRAGEIPETAEVQRYLGTFKAGTEYTGIPYGRVNQTMDAYGYEYGTVGNYIDFQTFVSSVSNADSMLCKTDVSSAAGHKSVVYATVCSGLTCYALNVPEVATASISNISGLSFIGKLNNSGTLLADELIKIGDVLNLAGEHTAIITDIIRSNEGVIQFVELADASSAGLADRNYADGLIGGICRRKGWSRTAFFQAGSWGDYSVYRYSGTVPYTPSLYVNVGDEFDCQRIEHYPCMPYEGEGFAYKTGYIPNNAIKILTSLSGYGFLKVFKDGVEISASPFTVEEGTTSIDLSVTDTGSYTAYLCNISNGDVTNLTYPCHWSIVS